MSEKKCPHCGAPMPEEAHYCLQCMSPCAPVQPSDAYQKLQTTPLKKRINRKQLSSILAAMILLVVLVPSVLAAPLQQQNAVTAEAAISNPQIVAEAAEEDAQPTTLLGKIKKAAKKAEQKVQSTAGKVKEAVGIAPTKEEKQAMAAEDAEENRRQQSKENKSKGTTGQSTTGNSTITGGTSTTAATGTTAHSTTGNTTKQDNNKNSTATTKPTTTQPESTTLPEPEYNKYEYTLDGNYAKVTKYTGNSKVVVIPSSIDGHQVKYYEAGTFTDKDMELAVFEDFTSYHTLWVKSETFKNCKKLKKIVFPDNADLGILSNFALGCTALSQIDIENGQYKMQDGALYYYNTNAWYAYYYCEGYTAERWNVADYCSAINCDSALQNNTHLRELRLNSLVTCPSYYRLPESLEAIYVADDNKYYYSKDGVLYYRSDTNNPNLLVCYPAGKTASSYTIPEDAVFDMGTVKNKNLKTLIIPKSATIRDGTLKYICRGSAFPNLETIKVQKGSAHENYIRTTFTGKVIVY